MVIMKIPAKNAPDRETIAHPGTSGKRLLLLQ